jgi:hypothetical protein
MTGTSALQAPLVRVYTAPIEDTTDSYEEMQMLNDIGFLVGPEGLEPPTNRL